MEYSIIARARFNWMLRTKSKPAPRQTNKQAKVMLVIG